MYKESPEVKLFADAYKDFRKRMASLRDLNVAFSPQDKSSLILMFDLLVIARENIQDEENLNRSNRI